MSKITVPKTAGEPPKKKRATAAEKAAKAQAAEAEKRKKEEEKAAKAQSAEAEKRKKEEEREKKRREKEEAERLKAEEKAAKKAEKAEKDQEKKQRAEEREKRKREKEEEETKKAKGQRKLTSMFSMGTPATKPQNRDEAKPATTAADDSSKETTLYQQMFKPFFVKENVRLANHRHEFSEEAREAKTKILDEFILGDRKQDGLTLQSDPLEFLQIPQKIRRGRVYPSVKKIMTEFHDVSSSKEGGDLSTESQNAQIRHTMEALKSVPVKSIKFREDVRPPYIGTISGPLPGGKSLKKLARKPISKDILSLNYDYDSEAEWQDEEGEDVDDLDDEEEEGELDEDMADFLDDSEDVGPARMVLEGGMEPESTGLCWESYNRSNSQAKMYKYRLEFILGKPSSRPSSSRARYTKQTFPEPLEHHHGIDPFSTAYWETPKSNPSAGTDATTTASIYPSRIPSTSSTTATAQPKARTPSVSPSDAFLALGTTPPTTATTTMGRKPAQPLTPEQLEALKDLVRSKPNYSKLGVIEVFAAEHPSCSRARVKAAFDVLFEKKGKGFKVRGE